MTLGRRAAASALALVLPLLPAAAQGPVAPPSAPPAATTPFVAGPSAELLTQLLGPLAPQGVIGRAGDWQLSVDDGFYRMANAANPAGARFVSIAAPAGALTLAAEVRIDPGEAPRDALVGAGLLLDAHGAGNARRFLLALVERAGEVGLYRGDAAGVARIGGRRLDARGRFVALQVVDDGRRRVLTADGIEVAVVPGTAPAGARVGIAAVGPGRFDLRGVRIETAAAPAVAADWGATRLGRVRIAHPPGWTAVAHDDGRIEATGDGARVVWWPVVRRGGGDDAALLQAMAAAAAPGRALGPVAADGAMRRAPLLDGNRPVGRIAFHRGGDGNRAAGLLVLAEAPAWDAAAAARAARILAAIRIEGRPPASVDAVLAARRWSDPAGAFAADLPQGWTVEGGSRVGADGTPSWHLRAIAPDGTRLFLGDPKMPVFVLPTERLARAGVKEGDTYSEMDGTPVLVAPLMPGLGFAEVHGMRLLAGQCAGEPEAVERRRRADLVEPLARALLPIAREGRGLEVGEVALRCLGRDGPMAAWVLAATDGAAGNRADAWSAPVVLGFAAPERDAAVALRATAALAASLTPSPLLTAGRGEDPAARAEAASRIAAAIGQTWWGRNAPPPPRRIAVTRPSDDPSRPLESGPDLDWIDATGRLVGSDRPALPPADADWRKLLAP